MNRKLKILLWTAIVILTVAFLGWKVFLYIISESFGTECQTQKTWRIENYEIVKMRCIGFAGPPWYPVYLYHDNKEIDHINSTNDSCLLKFANELGDTLEFDIYAEKLKGKEEK